MACTIPKSAISCLYGNHSFAHNAWFKANATNHDGSNGIHKTKADVARILFEEKGEINSLQNRRSTVQWKLYDTFLNVTKP